MLADPVASTNARARVVLGEWYAATGDLAAAHAAVAPLARESDVDATAVLVHVLLALNQAPLAASVVQALAAVADDAVTPQILEARVNLHLGGAKLQDARWGLDELVQTYAASPLLLTLLGVCHIALGNPADGARLLAEAVAMDPHACAEAQVDLVVAGATAGRSGLDQISQMWALLPRHAFTENLAAKAAAFDRAAANYST
ncbi:coatomer epsilon subunit-domain-containing protein [Blastocladiella britannica]|nr:coatomer epsilon subunit-domain-containing protein [Blastocladiella britannica]